MSESDFLTEITPHSACGVISLLTLMIGGRLVSVTAPLGSAGSNGPCSFLYRRSAPGIGLCFAKQVPERQPKKKVSLAISNGLIEHPERPPDSHSCSSRKWQRIRCGFHEPELLNFWRKLSAFACKRFTKFVIQRRGLLAGLTRWR